MIKVSVYQSLNLIHKIEMNGHAFAGDPGEDLICAGASSIGVGILNALEMLTNQSCDCTMKKANIKIVVKDVNDERTQIILQTMLIQLSTIEDCHPNHIKIKKQEV